MSMANARNASEVLGQSVYEPEIPEGYPHFAVVVQPDKDDNSGSLVDPKAAFNLLMERLGGILRANPK